MLKSVQIENYQSLKDVSLELAPLTVVVGESNKGKSAAVRALAALAFNEAGNEFIHRGEAYAAVTVELSSGNKVTWMKGKTGRYVVDEGTEGERVFTKIGQSVPEEIQALLGIRTLDVDGTKLTPQVSDQFDPPFLLRESAGKAARVLAKMTQLDVVVSAAAECNRDLKRARQRAADLDDQVTAKEEQLAAFAGLDEAQERLLAWETECEELLGVEQVVAEARVKLATLDKLKKDLRVPKVTVAEIDAALQDVKQAIDACSQARRLAQAEDRVGDLPAVTVGSLDECIDIVHLVAQASAKAVSYDRAEAQVKGAEPAVKAVAAEILALQEKVSHYGPCPTCGQLAVTS